MPRIYQISRYIFDRVKEGLLESFSPVW